jgi:two-component system sensor histidine kinase KdpD
VPRVRLSQFLASVLAVGATLALYRLVLSVNNTTVALSLLLIVLGVSARWGLAEATVASVVAVLGLNYYVSFR